MKFRVLSWTISLLVLVTACLCAKDAKTKEKAALQKPPISRSLLDWKAMGINTLRQLATSLNIEANGSKETLY